MDLRLKLDNWPKLINKITILNTLLKKLAITIFFHILHHHRYLPWETANITQNTLENTGETYLLQGKYTTDSPFPNKFHYRTIQCTQKPPHNIIGD